MGIAKMGTTRWGMLAARRALDEWHWQIDGCECDVWTLQVPLAPLLSLSLSGKKTSGFGCQQQFESRPLCEN